MKLKCVVSPSYQARRYLFLILFILTLYVSLSLRCGWNFFLKRPLRAPRLQITLQLGGPTQSQTRHSFRQAGHLRCLDAYPLTTGLACLPAVLLITIRPADSLPRTNSIQRPPGYQYFSTHLPLMFLIVCIGPFVYLHCILIIPAIGCFENINVQVNY